MFFLTKLNFTRRKGDNEYRHENYKEVRSCVPVASDKHFRKDKDIRY